MKKFLGSVLASAMLLGLVPSVMAENLQGGIKLNEPGTYPISDQKIEMTMFRLAMPNVIDFDSNDFTKFIEEKTGIHWTFQTAGMDNADTQVNLAMSSGELPDVFMFSTPSVSRYGVKEGQLLFIEDLIEDNMPNFSAYLKERPELKSRMTQSDGHIYGLPSINDCYHCSFRDKMWVNTKHLQEIGKEMPSTTDELLEVLRAYKDKHPDGIGIAGSIDGWGQQFTTWLTNAFILDPSTTSGKLLLDQNKKIISIAMRDEYREALKFMHQLYQEGFLYEAALTQNHEAYRTLMNEPGEPVLFAPYGTISDAFDATSNPEAYASYRVNPPIEGPKGVRLSTYFKHDGIAEDKFVLSKTCKYPEAALRFADYFYTLEGYLNMQYGADSEVDWTREVGDKKGLSGNKALYEIKNQYSSDPQNHDWQDLGLNFATSEIRMGAAVADDVDIASPEGLESLLALETREKCEPYAQKEGSLDLIPPLHLTAEEVDRVQLIVEEIDNYIENMRIEFITGSMDINNDNDWQTYLNGFDNVNMSENISIRQTAYDRQNKID